VFKEQIEVSSLFSTPFVKTFFYKQSLHKLSLCHSGDRKPYIHSEAFYV